MKLDCPLCGVFMKDKRHGFFVCTLCGSKFKIGDTAFAKQQARDIRKAQRKGLTDSDR